MKYIYIPLIFVFLLTISCEKFLSERPNKSRSNPTNIEDLQLLLDAAVRMNYGTYAILGEGSSDDFFLGNNGFNRLTDFDKAIYTWSDDIIYQNVNENVAWASPFQVISISNTILEEIPRVNPSKIIDKNHIKGAALFFRAFSYLTLTQTFCNAYNQNTAKFDLGLPLRFESDINLKSVRSNLEDTFQMMINDLNQAVELLPKYSDFPTRPNKVAAFSLLARLYLIMENYELALINAEFALNISNNHLLDYNQVDGTKRYPFQPFNNETIFFAYGYAAPALNPSMESYIDSNLYQSFDDSDLRKVLFFNSENNGYYSFRGSYAGTGILASFIGLTYSELLLIKSESSARLNEIDKSLESLNSLLENRYRYGEFEKIIVKNPENLLNIVLRERRKEMIFRGQRWSDLKRLNRDPNFQKVLYRKINNGNILIELKPNDSKYVFPIPQNVIQMTGMKQNPR